MFLLKNEKLINKIKNATNLEPDYIKESERLFHLYFKKSKTSTSYTKKSIGQLLGNEDVKRVIIVRRDILSNTFESQEGKMGAGKLAAQISHAVEAVNLKLLRNNIDYKDFVPPMGDYIISMEIKEDTAIKKYTEGEFKKIILSTKTETKFLNIYNKLIENNINSVLITDSGYTVFNNIPTHTCIGIEPMYNYIIDCFTGSLQLLK